MNNLFFNYKNENIPEKGCLLVSEPHLPDYNFERSVILLCEHSDEGSFGFVLNKMAEMSLSGIMSNAKGLDFPVGVGGPVERNTLHFLHRNNKDLEMSTPITDTIFWGGDYEQVTDRLRFGDAAEEDFLFFVGYFLLKYYASKPIIDLLNTVVLCSAGQLPKITDWMIDVPTVFVAC